MKTIEVGPRVPGIRDDISVHAGKAVLSRVRFPSCQFKSLFSQKLQWLQEKLIVTKSSGPSTVRVKCLVRKNPTQCPRPGLEPRPLDSESSARTWLKVAQNSFQYISRLRFWCVNITTLYQLMLQSWYQKTAQSLVNTLVLSSWHNRLP